MRATGVRSRRWLWCLLGFAAAGCAGTLGGHGWPSAGVAVRSTAVDEQPDPVCEALARASALSRTSAEELLPDAVAAFRSERTAKTRLWALLLLVKAEPRELGDAWALEILEASRTDTGCGAGQEGVESLLGEIFAERLLRTTALRRAEVGLEKEREAVRALQASLVEARAGLEAEVGRVKALRKERDEAVQQARALGASLEKERGRAADLEAQVEELKAIEEILERREGPAPVEGAR